MSNEFLKKLKRLPDVQFRAYVERKHAGGKSSAAGLRYELGYAAYRLGLVYAEWLEGTRGHDTYIGMQGEAIGSPLELNDDLFGLLE